MKNARLLVSLIFFATLLGALGVVSLSSRSPQLALEPAATTHSKPKPSAKTVKWEKDFESAMRQARERGKPILIDFYTDWCGVCKEMDKNVYPSAAFVAESQNWVMVKLNGDKRPDVAQAYGVRGYPTLIFAEGSGKPLDSLMGYADAGELVGLMRAAYSKWTPPTAT